MQVRKIVERPKSVRRRRASPRTALEACCLSGLLRNCASLHVDPALPHTWHRLSSGARHAQRAARRQARLGASALDCFARPRSLHCTLKHADSYVARFDPYAHSSSLIAAEPRGAERCAVTHRQCVATHARGCTHMHTSIRRCRHMVCLVALGRLITAQNNQGMSYRRRTRPVVASSCDRSVMGCVTA